MKSAVIIHEAGSSEGLSNVIANFFLEFPDIEVVNVSLSTTFDSVNNHVIYVAAVAYKYQD